MAKHNRPISLLVLLALLSFACNLPFIGGPNQTGTPPTNPTGQPADVSSGPTPPPTPEWVELDPPPPAGLVDALQARVDAGEITYEQSLVIGLQLLAGELDPGDELPELPTSLEGTGVIFDAQRYLQVGTDADTKAEIERLLRVLAPTPDVLLPYSAPEGSSYRPRGGLALLDPQETDCINLYAKGFPNNPNPVKCFQYKDETVGSINVKVFYPITSLVPGFTVAYADSALQAVKDAVATYSKLTFPGGSPMMKDVQVVFTLLASKSGSALAVVPTDPGKTPCQVILYPLAIASNEAKKSSAPTVPGGPNPSFAFFQQTVAHEMFHCFQVWNFPKLSANKTWGVNDWWGESTAEYFSNVVYPATNSEWRWMQTWAYESGKSSVVYRSYDNFGFFQYLGDKIGNNAILGLIGSLNNSAGGDEAAQEAQLAKYPNIQTLFDDYARAYMDGKILDTSSAALPTSPPFVLPEYRLPVSGDALYHLGAGPFTLMRYGLEFDWGYEYDVSTTITGGGGFDTSRPKDVIGGWGDLPPKVRTACAPIVYYFLMTSTTSPASDLYSIDFAAKVGNQLKCDQCLIGIWDIDIDSFAKYAAAPFADNPGFYQFDGAGGLWRYRFRADSTMVGEFNFFYGYQINQANAPYGNNITVQGAMTIDGTGEGTYLSDGQSLMTLQLNDDNVNIDQTLAMNGQVVQEGPIDMNGPVSPSNYLNHSVTYQCDAQAGELYLDFVPDANLPAVLFHRASGKP